MEAIEIRSGTINIGIKGTNDRTQFTRSALYSSTVKKRGTDN